MQNYTHKKCIKPPYIYIYIYIYTYTQVFSLLKAGIAVSNPAERVESRLWRLLCYAGSNICDRLTTRSEGSYRVCVCVCVWCV